MSHYSGFAEVLFLFTWKDHWPNAVNMNTYNSSNNYFKCCRKGTLTEKLLILDRARREHCFLWIHHTPHTPWVILLLWCNKSVEFLFQWKDSYGVSSLGDSNFQKVLFNILLFYLNYLFPTCALLCTKYKSVVPWTHKKEMLCWVSHFILFFFGRVYDLIPSFFIDSPLTGHSSL